MEKKENFEQAANIINAQTKTVGVSGCSCWLCRTWNWLISGPRAILNWLRNLNISGFINIAILCLIVVLFSVLIINLWNVIDSKNNRNKIAILKNAPQLSDVVAKKSIIEKIDPVIKTATVPAEISFNTVDKKLTIVVPLESVLPVATAPAPTKITLPLKKEIGNVYLDNGNGNDIIIDGEKPDGSRLTAMSEIRGNVYIQNMHYYTLPCGTKINGNLFVRNVGQLKFCGCFSVSGNIYVSTNSSFGAIPNGSTITGQIIL